MDALHCIARASHPIGCSNAVLGLLVRKEFLETSPQQRPKTEIRPHRNPETSSRTTAGSRHHERWRHPTSSPRRRAVLDSPPPTHFVCAEAVVIHRRIPTLTPTHHAVRHSPPDSPASAIAGRRPIACSTTHQDVRRILPLWPGDKQDAEA